MSTSQSNTATEPNSDRYRRLAATFTEHVAAVPPDRWGDPSPCEGWTARDVLRHVVESQSSFPSRVGVQVPAGPSVDDDPLAAWEHTRTHIQQILDDPERAELAYDNPMGRTTLGDSLGSFFCVDLVVHGWDIARATGTDDTIAPEDIAWVREFAARLGDAMRGPGGFAPAIDVPDAADEQTKLMAFLGRAT